MDKKDAAACGHEDASILNHEDAQQQQHHQALSPNELLPRQPHHLTHAIVTATCGCDEQVVLVRYSVKW